MKIIRHKSRYPGQSAGGKWNGLKWKVLSILELRQKKGLPPISLKELSDLTGVNYASLAVRLTNWTKWGYVQRHSTNGHYTYTLKEKGKKFLDWAAIFISRADRELWRDEIVAWQEQAENAR